MLKSGQVVENNVEFKISTQYFLIILPILENSTFSCKTLLFLEDLGHTLDKNVEISKKTEIIKICRIEKLDRRIM